MYLDAMKQKNRIAVWTIQNPRPQNRVYRPILKIVHAVKHREIIAHRSQFNDSEFIKRLNLGENMLKIGTAKKVMAIFKNPDWGKIIFFLILVFQMVERDFRQKRLSLREILYK